MQSTTIRLVSTLAVFMVCSAESSAGPWGKVIREAIEAVTKKSGKAAREGVEAATKKSARRGGALIVRVGDDVARPIVTKFGDDGARALNSLSPMGTQRLAVMADDLAASGHGRDWMRLIAERGDEVTDWLWKRRGSVAVGTVATAVLLQPEEFIKATERVAAPVVERAAAAIPWAVLWMIAILGGGFWFAAKWKLAWWRRE